MKKKKIAAAAAVATSAAALALGACSGSADAPQAGPAPVHPEPMTQSAGVTYRVWAIDGPRKADIELFGDAKWYDSKEALPFELTTDANPNAIYYAIDAALPEAGGHIMCSVTFGDQTVTAEAKGPHTLCTAQLDMP